MSNMYIEDCCDTNIMECNLEVQIVTEYLLPNAGTFILIK